MNNGGSYTPYLHLAYGPDAGENRNWDVLDQKAFDLARNLIANIPAGGDLAGFYPDPTIALLAVTDDKIVSVAWEKITGKPPIESALWKDDPIGEIVTTRDPRSVAVQDSRSFLAGQASLTGVSNQLTTKVPTGGLQNLKIGDADATFSFSAIGMSSDTGFSWQRQFAAFSHAVQIGADTAALALPGMLQWTGTHFQGRTASAWLDLDAPGIPAGGTTGQSLVKASNTDYAVTWSTVSGGGGSGAFWTQDDVNGIYISQDAGLNNFNVRVAGNGLILGLGTSVTSAVSLRRLGSDLQVRSLARMTFINPIGAALDIASDGSITMPTITGPTTTERLAINGAILLGDTTATTLADGTLRYAAGKFQGRVSGAWVDIPGAGGGGGPPSGPASGDLTGTYPGPTLVAAQKNLWSDTTTALTPLTATRTLVVPGPATATDAAQLMGGTRSAKGRLIIRNDWDAISLGINRKWNGTAYTQDITSQPGWEASLDISSDSFFVRRQAISNGANVALLTVDSAGRATMPGSSDTTDQSTIIFGTRTPKGRLSALANTDWVGLSANAGWNGTAWVQDDGAKASWNVSLQAAGDTFAIGRNPPGGGATVNLLSINGGTGLTTCTLAANSVSNGMLQASAKSSFASGTVTANLSTTTTVTQFATITASGLNGRLVMIFLNAMMGLTSTSGASNITIYVKRNSVAFANYNLYVTGGTFEVPVPLNLTVADSTAPSGSVTYTFEMQASVAGTNIHTAAANQGTLLLFSWPT